MLEEFYCMVLIKNSKYFCMVPILALEFKRFFYMVLITILQFYI